MAHGTATIATLPSFARLHFDNRFTRDLPGDPSSENRPRQVYEAAYSRVLPKPTTQPVLVHYSAEVAAELGLHVADIVSPEFLQLMSGNAVADGMDPHAACYGGHQFGNWAGQLGDGRAITLGEVVNEPGERFMLQLKGAGPTPYSRMADGLAVLRSSIREFLCSEAMHHLGVPTTRALSLATTGDQVLRDMFYDGRAAYEPGAVVCRVAPSFIRFGSFEIFAAREDHETLRMLADHTIATHFPHLGDPGPETYAAWFTEVARRTAEMIVHWQRVGFVHGVMNTDNMSIHGLTIDYGPYGWLEDYDPSWTPNTTDAANRRYRFANQPAMAQWNLTRLANAIFPLVGDADLLHEGLERYVDGFNVGWQQMMNDKLGLGPVTDGDEQLVGALLDLLPRTETDMTLFFRGLAQVPATSGPLATEALLAPIAPAYYLPEQLTGDLLDDTVAWLERYRTRARATGLSDIDRADAMNQVNPLYVLRNYLAQLAIDAAQDQDDHGMVAELLDVLRNPYREQPGMERYAEKRPDWARTRAGCSQLSCSS
mgnify:FL=1